MDKDNSERVIYFGETDYRNKRHKFGIKEKDRSRHLYVIGKTGMGKSTLLENMAIQDIENGSGIGFIDPHGGSAEKLLDFLQHDGRLPNRVHPHSSGKTFLDEVKITRINNSLHSVPPKPER